MSVTMPSQGCPWPICPCAKECPMNRPMPEPDAVRPDDELIQTAG